MNHVSGYVRRGREHPRRFDFPSASERRGANSYKFSVYVPSTQDFSKKISPSEFTRRVNETRNYLSKTFGGTTRVRGMGSYVGKNGQVVQEEVAVVTVFANQKDYYRNDAHLKSWILRKKIEWGQESMGYSFEGPESPVDRILFV